MSLWSPVDFFTTNTALIKNLDNGVLISDNSYLLVPLNHLITNLPLKVVLPFYYITVLGHKNKKCLRSHVIDGRSKAEVIKHAIWRVLWQESVNFRLAPWSEKWHFLALLHKISFSFKDPSWISTFHYSSI